MRGDFTLSCWHARATNAWVNTLLHLKHLGMPLMTGISCALFSGRLFLAIALRDDIMIHSGPTVVGENTTPDQFDSPSRLTSLWTDSAQISTHIIRRQKGKGRNYFWSKSCLSLTFSHNFCSDICLEKEQRKWQVQVLCWRSATHHRSM